MKPIVLVLLSLAFASCKTAPYQIGALSGWIYYVIPRPPKNSADLLRTADAFFRASVTPADIERLEQTDDIAAGIRAYFYQETALLNRRFTFEDPPYKKKAKWLEGESYQSYVGVALWHRDYWKDLLVTIGLYKHKSGIYSYWYELKTKDDFGTAQVSPTEWFYRSRKFKRGKEPTGRSTWTGEILLPKANLPAFLWGSAE